MMQTKREAYQKASVELLVIIKHMTKELRSKIPDEIIKGLESAKDRNYQYNYDESLPLYEQNILNETKSLLSIIYSRYLCSEEEKEKWKEYDKFYLKKQEEEKSKLYESDPKKILKSRNENKKINLNKNDSNKVENQHLELTVKENIFAKLFNKLKKIFGFKR